MHSAPQQYLCCLPLAVRMHGEAPADADAALGIAADATHKTTAVAGPQAPSFTVNPHNKDVYSAYNKPEAVIDWLAHNEVGLEHPQCDVALRALMWQAKPPSMQHRSRCDASNHQPAGSACLLAAASMHRESLSPCWQIQSSSQIAALPVGQG